MPFRFLVSGILLVLLLIIGGPVYATLSGVVVADTGNKTTPWFHQWQEFRRAVDQLSAGDILLDYLIFGELGDDNDMASAVIDGRANIGAFRCEGLAKIIPEFSIPDLPYLFGGDAEADFVFDRFLFPIFSEIADRHGLILLQWQNFGWTDFYSKAALRMPHEFQNLQLRTAPNLIGPRFVRALNAEPVQVGETEALPVARLDKIAGGVGDILHYTPERQALYPFYLKTHHSYECGAVFANKAWFQKASPNQQEIIRRAFMPLPVSRAEVAASNEQKIRDLPAKGITLLDIQAQDQIAWAAIGLPLHEPFLATLNPDGRKIFDAIKLGKSSFLHQ